MNLINRALRPFGLMLIPRYYSSKMIREHANVSECFHPAKGGSTVRWMRQVADLVDGSIRDRH